MTLTQEQRKIVEENMGLVGKVIRDKVHRSSRGGIYSYDDLFQAGCIGLCKAAATDKGGCFSTYAYRLIWNEICDELIRATRLTQKEQASDTIEILIDANGHPTDPIGQCELRQMLEQAKRSARGAAAKGIRCLELSMEGYSSQEIGRIVDAEPATVRMWMTKARRYLGGLPELREFIDSEAV